VVELKRAEAKFVLSCVASFAGEFERGVAAVLAEELPGVEPPEVREVREQLQLLQRQLESRQSIVRVHEAMVGLIKCVLTSERRRVAEGLDRPLSKATAPGVVKALQQQVLRYDAFIAREPFATARAQRVPRLTDFMSIRFAAEAMRDAPKLAPRVYDEKFHILETPRLFLTDLAYYRHECGLRGAELAVTYVDIDDFKAINSRLTETVVDLLVLGPFLELVEAWSFGHGHAYRFGGDEYVILLPNVSWQMAVIMLDELRQRVLDAQFRAKDVRLSITQGVCRVDSECPLTDREILARANAAKAFAKATRKGSIAAVEAPGWAPALVEREPMGPARHRAR
jgi:diguanylate cyclase (GGDEF)-like protein